MATESSRKVEICQNMKSNVLCMYDLDDAKIKKKLGEKNPIL